MLEFVDLLATGRIEQSPYKWSLARKCDETRNRLTDKTATCVVADEDAALGGLLQETGNRFLQAGKFGAKRVHVADERKGIIDESEGYETGTSMSEMTCGAS